MKKRKERSNQTQNTRTHNNVCVAAHGWWSWLVQSTLPIPTNQPRKPTKI
jgi:hypothetical protein